MDTLRDIATIISLILGASGLALSIANYFRDKPKLLINLQWDMSSTDINNKDLFGVVSVANVGRRPVFISHVAIVLPKGYPHKTLLLTETIYGKKLCEGDQPERFLINQHGLSEYSKDWHKLYAVIYDPSGKGWKSNKVAKENKPSWVGQNA